MTSMSSRRHASLASLAALGIVLSLSLGCSIESPESPVAPDRSITAASGGPDFAAAIAAQERHTPALLARSGVVGTGVGLVAGVPSVRIYLATPRGAAGLPTRLDDVPVSFEVTGLFWAGSDPTTRERPAPVGYSVGHPDITAGTLGARVVDGSGNVYILSNNHVIANSNDASIGDPTYQPGPFDGGTSADSLASLSDFQVIDFSGGNNTMDAGVASTTTDNVSASTPTDDGYGAPSSQIHNDGNGDGFFDDLGSLVGVAVMKYGRTTKLTTGEILEVNVTVTVCYEGFAIFCSKSATFVDQIAIGDGTFSDGGDSGSLIVSQSGKNPVGLLFAGSSTRTIANRIDLVLDRFNVTVDGSSDDGGGDTNSPPTASFTFTCTDLSCDFDGTGSSDSDGTIQTHSWDFGDGNGGSGATVSHTYDAGGTYTVTLTVTDDDGASDSDSQDVTVSAPGGGGDISLTATGYKVRGLQKADLEWSGATSTNVDVVRNGTVIVTTANDGFHTDNIDQRGGGSYTYQVCEAGTSTCSNEATVTF